MSVIFTDHAQQFRLQPLFPLFKKNPQIKQLRNFFLNLTLSVFSAFLLKAVLISNLDQTQIQLWSIFSTMLQFVSRMTCSVLLISAATCAPDLLQV